MVKKKSNTALIDFLNISRAGIVTEAGEFRTSDQKWSIKVQMENRTDHISARGKIKIASVIEPSAVVLFCFDCNHIISFLGGDDLKMLVNSANINNGTTGLLRFPAAVDREPGEPKPDSSWWSVIGDGSINTILFAFHLPVKNRTFIRQRAGSLEIGCFIDRPLNEGEEFETDQLLIFWGDRVHKLLGRFAEICKSFCGRVINKSRPLAWNSWDYYWTSFEMDDLRENLRSIVLANDRLSKPVDTIVIDMGWFTDFGDWRANGRFPAGIKAAAAEIQRYGLIPGIWVAPFIVHWSSKAFLRTPGICAKDSTGFVLPQQWGLAPAGFVDPLSPEGRNFIYKIFKDLFEAGFRYFKLDFLHYFVTMGARLRFSNNNSGRIEIVRKGLEIIREAIGNESYILACGCQPEAAAGIVDACRIGGDISTYFSTTKICAQFLATRYWMNNTLFLADPDFLIVRGETTACDPKFNHNPYHGPLVVDESMSRSGEPWSGINEPRIWATLVAMSGGSLTLADHLDKLNEAGFDILNKALELHSSVSAVPLDLMERVYPSYWLKVEPNKRTLAIINWDDDPKLFSFERYGARSREFWTNETITECSVIVPARDVRVMVWQNRVK